MRKKQGERGGQRRKRKRSKEIRRKRKLEMVVVCLGITGEDVRVTTKPDRPTRPIWIFGSETR